jgi:hypothetical protein
MHDRTHARTLARMLARAHTDTRLGRGRMRYAEGLCKERQAVQDEGARGLRSKVRDKVKGP